jgi:hypothetical protein
MAKVATNLVNFTQANKIFQNEKEFWGYVCEGEMLLAQKTSDSKLVRLTSLIDLDSGTGEIKEYLVEDYNS